MSELSVAALARPVHPGELLKGDLARLGMSACALALELRVPSDRISGIINGHGSVTADTALRLGHYFSTGPQYWMNLQTSYDLAQQANESYADIKAAIRPRSRLDTTSIMIAARARARI